MPSVRPASLSLHLGLLVEAEDAALAVLELALQTAILALHEGHPELCCVESAPYDPSAGIDGQLASALVSSALGLLGLLRSYRAARDANTPF